MNDRADVLRLFGDQFGLATIAQLRDLGLARTTIDRARRRGTLVDVLAGVVRNASHAGCFEAEALAVQFRLRPDGFLSGPTAARLYGLRSMPARPIHAMIDDRRQCRSMPSWVRLTHSSWADDFEAVNVRGPFRVEPPERMLLRLADLCNAHRLERAAEDAWHLGLITPRSMRDYLADVRRSGRHGVTKLESWLDSMGDRLRASQSGLELDFVDAMRRAGLPEFERQHPLVLLSGELIHLDFAFPDLMLAVEPGHMWFHGGDLKARADAARDRACTEIGWQVVRYDESARDDLAAAGRELARIYAARRRLF